MSKKNNLSRVRKWMAFVVVLFLLLIALPFVLNFFIDHEHTDLVGVAAPGSYSVSENLTYHSWMSGEFQTSFTNWYTEAFGGHDNFKRQYNQALYSFFHMGNSVILSDGSLLQGGYIEEALTQYPSYLLSDEELNRIGDRILKIQTLVEQQGKAFVFVLSPNKMDFTTGDLPYYEKLKPRYADNEGRSSVRLRSVLDQKGVHYVDGKKTLEDFQAQTKIEPFAKTGIHWTYASTTAVAQEIVECLNEWYDMNIHPININGFYTQKLPESSDADLYDLLNIYCGTMDDAYYYPVCNMDLNNTSLHEYDTPDIFMQGTSFCALLLDALKSNDVSNNFDRIFYSTYIFKQNVPNGESITSFHDASVQDALSGKDVYILEASDVTLRQYLISLDENESLEKTNKFSEYFLDYLENTPLTDQKFYPECIDNVQHISPYNLKSIRTGIKNESIQEHGIRLSFDYNLQQTFEDPEYQITAYINEKLIFSQKANQEKGTVDIVLAPDDIAATDGIYDLIIQFPQVDITSETFDLHAPRTTCLLRYFGVADAPTVGGY